MIDLRLKGIKHSEVDINTRTIIIVPDKRVLKRFEKEADKTMSGNLLETFRGFLTERNNFVFRPTKCVCLNANERGKVWLADIVCASWANNYANSENKKLEHYIVLGCQSITYMNEGDL